MGPLLRRRAQSADLFRRGRSLRYVARQGAAAVLEELRGVGDHDRAAEGSRRTPASEDVLSEDEAEALRKARELRRCLEHGETVDGLEDRWLRASRRGLRAAPPQRE